MSAGRERRRNEKTFARYGLNPSDLLKLFSASKGLQHAEMKPDHPGAATRQSGKLFSQPWRD